MDVIYNNKQYLFIKLSLSNHTRCSYRLYLWINNYCSKEGKPPGLFQKSIDNRYLKHVVQHNAEHETKNKCYLIRLTRSFLNHKIRIILESAIKAELRAKELRYWHTSTVYCHSQKLKSYSRLVQHNKRLTRERTAPEVSFEWWHARVLSRN